MVDKATGERECEFIVNELTAGETASASNYNACRDGGAWVVVASHADAGVQAAVVMAKKRPKK